MRIKKQLLFAFLIILMALVVSAVILYFKNELPWFNKICTRLLTGTVSVEVAYPSDFITVPYLNFIQVTKNNGVAHGEVILDISTGCCVMSLERLIQTSVKDFPGHEFKKFNFNGHNAVISINGDSKDASQSYWIPVGNRLVTIAYRPSSLSEDLRTKAKKMLRSITISETKEDVKQARVESCDK